MHALIFSALWVTGNDQRLLAAVKMTLYTDPGCPFGFTAQRQEVQLMWHYGHAADVERRMIVLSQRLS
jgi:hypothetical protein